MRVVMLTPARVQRHVLRLRWREGATRDENAR